MKRRIIPTTAFAALVVCASCDGFAANGSDDRLTLMASGSTLTDTNGGGAGALGWLHNFTADTLFGLKGEYQSIGDARWRFGTLTLAHGFGQASRRTTILVEVNEGSGKDNVHSYDYSIYGGSITQSITRQLSIVLEDRQIKVDTVRGNLPKIGINYLWSPSFLTAVSYAKSVSGTEDTELASIRFDGFGKRLNWIAGAATGKTSPVILNVPDFDAPSVTTHEYFAGVSKSFARADFTLLGDYLKLAESERVTVTLSCTVRLRSPGTSR